MTYSTRIWTVRIFAAAVLFALGSATHAWLAPQSLAGLPTTPLAAGAPAPVPAGLPDFTPLVQQNAAAVVNISVTRKLASRAALHGLPDSLQPFFRLPPEADAEQTSVGSGFVIEPTGYILTNAHVVAGASTIRVSLDNTLLDARAVLFDPELDVAVLYVPGVGGRPQRFAASDPTRGAEGAAIGFAGGGPMVILPAAVSGAYPATGRDIYGKHRITRSILELHAGIEPGDSGGPFVLRDGTIGGLVFAESKTDPAVGYALAPTTVATRIGPALVRTGEVAVGPCIR